MNGSSIPGAPGAAGGSMMLAAGPQPATYQVQWIGPFPLAEALFRGWAVPTSFQFATVKPGVSQTVPLDQMLNLAASDPFWWEIVG